MGKSQMLTLIRGLPGSGKSTVARMIAAATNAAHFESDMFFVEDDGVYRFKHERIGAAHSWCLGRTREAITSGFDVVVSNTFVALWEMKPYIAIAEEFNVPIQIIEVTGFNASVHDVPDDVIDRMRESWEVINRSEIKGWEW